MISHSFMAFRCPALCGLPVDARQAAASIYFLEILRFYFLENRGNRLDTQMFLYTLTVY